MNFWKLWNKSDWLHKKTCAIHAHTSFISTLICRRFLVSGSPGIFILSERSLRGRHSPVFSVLVTSLLSSSGLPDVALASLLHSSSIFAGMSNKLIPLPQLELSSNVIQYGDCNITIQTELFYSILQ